MQQRDPRVAAALLYALVPEITYSRSEPEAEQRTGGEHLIGKAGRIGVMLPNPQIRVVPEQTIKDVRGIANG